MLEKIQVIDPGGIETPTVMPKLKTSITLEIHFKPPSRGQNSNEQKFSSLYIKNQIESKKLPSIKISKFKVLLNC